MDIKKTQIFNNKIIAEFMVKKTLEKKLLINKSGTMAKYLIFRTDRIGDFITSQVVTNSISEVSKNQVDVVASRYNSKYIKNFKYINRIFILINHK